MRVLLAEDDHMIAQAVAANLKDSGYAVDWVKNGSQVSTALQAQNYDLLLLDLGLPGKTTSSNPSTWRSCKPVCAPSCAATAGTAKPC